MKIMGSYFVGILVLLGLAAALAAQQAPAKNQSGEKPGPAPAAEVKRGKALFNMHCSVCHYPASTAKKIGPGLKGITKRGISEIAGKPSDDASLRGWIEKGGKNMPGFKAVLSNQQVSDLISYLKTL
jgi:mono/diheme cytochrome c family protein